MKKEYYKQKQEERRKNGCGHKRIYDTHFEADIAAAHHAFDLRDKAIVAYKCFFCNLFHLGHPSPDPKRHLKKNTS